MEKRRSFDEKAFPIIFFVSVYLIVSSSLLLGRIPLDENAGRYLSFALPQIIYISAALVYAFVTRIDLRRAVPIKFRAHPSVYFWAPLAAIGLFCAALLPNLLLLRLLKAVGLRTAVAVPSTTGAGGAALTLLILCVLPAAGEELLFRGVLVSAFEELGGVPTVILSGIFFSLSHFSTAQTVYQFFIGITLAYLFIKTRNLLVCVLIHFINNVLALFLADIVPFFGRLTLSASGLAVLIPLCAAGFFILAFAARKLTAGNAADALDAPADGSAGEAPNDAVAERAETRGNRFFRDVRGAFDSVIGLFKRGEARRRAAAFKTLFPPRKKPGAVIKISLAVIIGLWLITALL